jgi:hypothetical protein
MDDAELLAALGVEVETKKASARTAQEERIIAGFEDIERFYEEHGRRPQHGEGRDIFERLYAVRLDRLRELDDCRALLAPLDKHGLLDGAHAAEPMPAADLDDAALLAELGIEQKQDDDITELRHVRSREEVRAAAEIANRTRCTDFASFKPLFDGVKEDIEKGVRETRRFGQDASIRQGDWFILGGQMVYVADVGDEFRTEYDRPDRRLRVIYDNATESDVLLRSLQRSLYKDEAGRRISTPIVGPLFGSVAEDGDKDNGTLYVLRSLSNHPFVAEHREVIHKIGVTGNTVKVRIADAVNDPTYLLAEVEQVASYRLFGIKRTALEGILHKIFEPGRLDLVIEDRFGKPVKPREWFLVPIPVIDDVVEKIKDGTITNFVYDPAAACLKRR